MVDITVTSNLKILKLNEVVKTHNKSLHWIFTPLRYVKTSEFNRWAAKARPLLTVDENRVVLKRNDTCDRR